MILGVYFNNVIMILGVYFHNVIMILTGYFIITPLSRYLFNEVEASPVEINYKVPSLILTIGQYRTDLKLSDKVVLS